MQKIVVTIEDQTIEQAMSEIARHDGINIQEFIMQAIQCFIKQKSLMIKKLDPFQHSVQIHYAVAENVSDVTPFAFVKNSATFGKEVREKTRRS